MSGCPISSRGCLPGLEVNTDRDVATCQFSELHCPRQDFRELGVFRQCVLYLAINFPIGESRSNQPFSRPRARMESRQPKKFSAMSLDDLLRYPSTLNYFSY